MTAPYEHFHTVTPDEIDEQGHANNVCYVSWMQDAAIAHSATLGWNSKRYQEIGSTWVARSHKIEYRQSCFEGEEIVVETWVASMKKATSTRCYRILRRSDKALLAEAETHWAFIDLTTGRPTRIPPIISDAFAVLQAQNEAR